MKTRKEETREPCPKSRWCRQVSAADARQKKTPFLHLCVSAAVSPATTPERKKKIEAFWGVPQKPDASHGD